MTGEATTNVTGNVYQVTSATKRILDPTVSVVVKDGGTPVSGVTIDYLYGKVTLPAPPGGAVTVDANWLAMLSVAEVRKASLSGQRAQLDTTVWGVSGGFKTSKDGVLDWGGQAELLSQPTDDLDTGTGGTQSFFDFLNNGTPKLIEVYRAGKTWRGWVNIENIGNESVVDGLVTATVGYKGSQQLAQGAALAFE